MNNRIFTSAPQKEYALIDSGDGMKLERYGSVKVVRPDPQALWRKTLSEKEWAGADARFARESSKGDHVNRAGKKVSGDDESERGKWIISRPGLPETWPIVIGELTMNIKLTPFKHTGLFPEQLNNWLWCRELIKERVSELKSGKRKPAAPGGDDSDNTAAAKRPTVLNLFGYTGGATLSAALGGAEVTHVDASRAAITWANDNAKSSGLSEAPIRWILDDAFAFVKREVRRGKKYDAIIMDPPSYGRGAKGEIWKIEEHFLDFFEDCMKLLSDTPLFVVVNGYAAGYSAIAYENNMRSLVKKHGGAIESGELTLTAETGIVLPCGIVSRWRK